MSTLSEFSTTALLLTIFGTLLVASAALSRGLERAGIPVALLFLVLGMLAASTPPTPRFAKGSAPRSCSRRSGCCSRRR